MEQPDEGSEGEQVNGRGLTRGAAQHALEPTARVHVCAPRLSADVGRTDGQTKTRINSNEERIASGSCGHRGRLNRRRSLFRANRSL